MSEANKTAMKEFFERVYNQGDVGFLDELTQTGEFMGVPPTNKPIVVTGIDIVRVEAGKAVEHWHEWSGMELLQQLGVLGSQ